MIEGIVLGFLIAILILLAITFLASVVSRHKIIKSLDEIEDFLDTKRPSATVGGTAAFLMPDRVSEISKAKPGVSIDEVLT